MKAKTIKAVLTAMALCCVFGAAQAGQELDAINAQVEQQAVEIDQKYGVLLDTRERDDLKLDLIVKKALADHGEQSVKDIAKTVFATYDITDPTEQRHLLIKLEAQATVEQKGVGQGGTPPEFP